MGTNFSDEYLRLLSAISEVAIIAYTDSRGRITFANKNFCEISGYSLEELYNQDHRLLNSDYHEAQFFKEMYATIKQGKVWRGDIQNKNKNGSLYWVDTQIIPIYGENNEIESFASVRFDITERKKMEARIIHLEKLASLGEISAVIAHEINNPLAIIQMSVDSMVKELKKEESNQDKIDDKIVKIMKSTNRITKLVRGLKTFSRSSNNEELAEVNLKNFIEEVLAYSKCKCVNNGIVFNTNEIPELKFECRPDQISQVLLNLINNAHDAVSELSEKWIEFSIEADPGKNEISFLVRDSGHGIPEPIAGKILTPFFTTKEIGKGTGLGLSISKAIAEEHCGDLYLDSGDSHTLFVFKIPLRHLQSFQKAS